MNGLRKVMTLTSIFAVLFLFRIAWLESSELGLSSSPLMQTGVYSASYSQSSRPDNHFSFGLALNLDTNLKENVLQTKASVADEKLNESFELLKSTSSGRPIALYLEESRVKITFGKPKTAGAAAVFVPSFIGNSGKIVVSERLRDEQVSVIAAILAHEGTHAKMDSILDYDSVEQEYNCYAAQARVWQETRTALTISAGEFQADITESSPENDYALEIMNMNRKKAFDQIWQDYKQIGIDLPLE